MTFTLSNLAEQDILVNHRGGPSPTRGGNSDGHLSLCTIINYPKTKTTDYINNSASILLFFYHYYNIICTYNRKSPLNIQKCSLIKYIPHSHHVAKYNIGSQDN